MCSCFQEEEFKGKFMVALKYTHYLFKQCAEWKPILEDPIYNSVFQEVLILP